jgi:hypothetical protein
MTHEILTPNFFATRLDELRYGLRLCGNSRQRVPTSLPFKCCIARLARTSGWA